jgi:hypothetical protein
VPGLVSSDHYAVRVRAAGADARWQSPFVFQTACKDFGQFDPKKLEKINTEGYCPSLSGWSHSYVNFETGGPVEVEIAKVDGTAKRRTLVAAYERLKASGVANLHYNAGEHLLGEDGEAAVDGSQPPDLGMLRIAESLEPVLKGVLPPQ